MFDFDKNFEAFALSWYEAHKDKIEDEEAFEQQMPALYEQWLNTPVKEIGGVTPQSYFAKETPDSLVEKMAACAESSEPPSVLLDAIAECEACAQPLAALVASSSCDHARLIASNLLTEMGAAQPLDAYVKLLTDTKADEGLVERAVEVLCDYAGDVREKLYAVLPSCSLTQKGMVAEILVNAAHDDRTYKLLEELFAAGDNVPYYAGLIGKYGDERASGMLYRALDTCDYAEYLEIKNAIERMGGVVDVDRDFSEDPTFLAVKNLR
ncbi:MAG: hypothetical protein K2M95_04150 [Clostridiales bacterium]|nr:hypothetical protein [Clostridiales bacterium]